MVQLRSRASVLLLALSCAGVMTAGPAAAQYYYPGDPRPYYGPPAYAPPIYAPRPANVVLPPWEVRRILLRMGYRQVHQPHLSGRLYAVQASDAEGAVALSIDAFTGRVIAARPLSADRPTIAVPESIPPGEAPPKAALRSEPVPLPPQRPSVVELENGAPPASSQASVPQAGAIPASPSPEQAVPPVQAGAGADVTSAGAASANTPGAPQQATVPPAQAMTDRSGTGAEMAARETAPTAVVPAPVNGAAKSAATSAAKSAPVAGGAGASMEKAATADPAPPRTGVDANVGAGTGTPTGASAGSASVLSRASQESGAQ